MHRAIVFSVCSILAGGCASNSGVLKLASGEYFVARQAATGYEDTSHIRSEALKDTEITCAIEDGKVKLLKVYESKPPFVLGNFPRVEVTFTCTR